MPPAGPSPFETDPVYVVGPGYKQGPLNPVYFATADAAAWLAARYQAMMVKEVPGLSPGPYSYTAPMRVLVYPAGEVIAGLLANNFLDFSTDFSYADQLNKDRVSGLQTTTP